MSSEFWRCWWWVLMCSPAANSLYITPSLCSKHLSQYHTKLMQLDNPKCTGLSCVLYYSYELIPAYQSRFIILPKLEIRGDEWLQILRWRRKIWWHFRIKPTNNVGFSNRRLLQVQFSSCFLDFLSWWWFNRPAGFCCCTTSMGFLLH